MNDIPEELAQYAPRNEEEAFGFDFSEEAQAKRAAYAKRVHEELLPNFPEDVLTEWIHRHWGDIEYSWLGFETLSFDLQDWNTDQIPGREAFRDPTLCDGRSAVIREHKWTNQNWLANYMNEHKTWPHPIVLLHNADGLVSPSGEELKQPYHLLEGHGRLSYFVALRDLGEAAQQHSVWVVTKQ